VGHAAAPGAGLEHEHLPCSGSAGRLSALRARPPIATEDFIMSGFNQLREECKDEVVATLRDLRQVSNPWRLHGSVEQQPANLGVSLLDRSLEPG